MGLLQECAIVQNAKMMAAKKGLDPSKVTCCGCEDGTSCAYSPEGLLSASTMDAVQDMRLKKLENEGQVKKFYGKIVAHFQVEAIVENQHRPS